MESMQYVSQDGSVSFMMQDVSGQVRVHVRCNNESAVVFITEMVGGEGTVVIPGVPSGFIYHDADELVLGWRGSEWVLPHWVREAYLRIIYNAMEG